LGYSSGKAVDMFNSTYKTDPTKLLLNNVKCNGTEEELLECQFRTGEFSCNYAAAVECSRDVNAYSPSEN
jgi:hypothetical protein